MCSLHDFCLVQLNVKDVHLRYEDDKTNPACPFACGLTIKKLSVHSTDSTWVSYNVSRVIEQSSEIGSDHQEAHSEQLR